MSGSQRCKHAQLVGREVVSASVSVMQRAKCYELYTPLARSAPHCVFLVVPSFPPGSVLLASGRRRACVAPEVLRRSWRIAP